MKGVGIEGVGVEGVGVEGVGVEGVGVEGLEGIEGVGVEGVVVNLVAALGLGVVSCLCDWDDGAVWLLHRAITRASADALVRCGLAAPTDSQ
jgi:hypothetical protein